MKKWLRIVMTVLVVALAAAVTVLVSGSAASRRHGITCNSVDIRLPEGPSFVSEQDVKDYLRDYYGACMGERIDSIDLRCIESVLDRRSAIRKSQAWTTADGVLHISITQREPAVRFQTPDYGFYADDRGYIFPLQKAWDPQVPVVDGHLPLSVPEGFRGELLTRAEQDWMEGILKLVSCMAEDRNPAVNAAGISVCANGDLVLVPGEGRERFIFGDSGRAQEKLALIEDYYKYIQPSKDEGYYRTVNVKYPGQIICRKK